jgi:hypothetical protein
MFNRICRGSGMLSRVRGSIGVLGLVLLLIWLVPGLGDSWAEHEMDDGDVLEQYPGLSKAFKSNTFSILVNDGWGLGQGSKMTRIVGEGVENTFELDGLSVRTEYRGAKSKRTRVKQVVTITNTADRDRTVEYRARMRIEAQRIAWDGEDYPATWVPRLFRAYLKQVSVPEFANKLGKGDLEGLGEFKDYMHEYMAGSRIVFEAGGARGIYDWSDALHLHPEVWVYRVGDVSYVEFVVRNITVPAGDQAIIDPILGLDDPAEYDLRFDGKTNVSQLGYKNSVAVGDVNGDNQGCIGQLQHPLQRNSG